MVTEVQRQKSGLCDRNQAHSLAMAHDGKGEKSDELTAVTAGEQLVPSEHGAQRRSTLMPIDPGAGVLF